MLTVLYRILFFSDNAGYLPDVVSFIPADEDCFMCNLDVFLAAVSVVFQQCNEKLAAEKKTNVLCHF